MQRLLIIIRLFKEYILGASLILLSLLLLSLNDNSQIRRIRSITVGFVGALQDAVSFIPNFFALRLENSLLRRTNVDLMDEVNLLREAKLENLRLRSLLGLTEKLSYPVVAAEVVGRTSNPLRNTITVNIGSDDGVKPNMPIVTDEGLVGRVVATSKHYSVGQLVTNRDFRATAKVQRSRVNGILAWEGGDFTVLINVAKTLDVNAGDVVVTSEVSRMFPPNIRIGVVASVTEQPGNLFKRIEVANSVNFSKLEEVFVVQYREDPEQVQLEEKVLR
ncbi:MAG TPA: rod shape-determining protein MreC [Rhodothermia bacterium]|nr:rod shape-determining protein MreC [Rhodothermia bacterium]